MVFKNFKFNNLMYCKQKYTNTVKVLIQIPGEVCLLFTIIDWAA